MNIWKFIVLTLFLNSCWAASFLDENHFKVFSETNFCVGCNLNNAVILEDHDEGNLLNCFAEKAKFKGSLFKTNFSGSIMDNAIFGLSFYSELHIQKANFSKKLT